MKTAVTRSQRLAGRRVVVERQPPRGDGIEKANPHQPLADRAEIGRPALDQCRESGLPHLERG